MTGGKKSAKGCELLGSAQSLLLRGPRSWARPRSYKRPSHRGQKRESAYRCRQGNTHMKAMKLPKELQSFLEVAETAGQKMLVFTKKRRPVAALVSLRKVDRESLALSTNPQFLRIIETARKEVRAGKTTSLEALERKFGVTAPKKRIERTRKTRRSS